MSDTACLDAKGAADKMITIALARADGNRTEAAAILGMSRRTLGRRIRERIKQDIEENEGEK